MENCNVLCSFCLQGFTKIDNFVFHLKNIHNKKPFDTFTCNQNFCNQSFNNINVFKRHLKTMHILKNNTQSIINNNCNTDTDEDNTEVEPKLSTIQLQENQNNSVIIPNEDSFSNRIDIPSSTRFLLALHNKNNFTRADVQFIKNLVNKFITDDDSSENHQAGTNILKQSEYMFFKHLTEKNIFQLPIYHTINEQISEINIKGIPTLSNEKIKSVVMPISFQLQKYLEMKGSMDIIKTHLAEMKNSVLINSFLNCEIWKKKNINVPKQNCFTHLFIFG